MVLETIGGALGQGPDPRAWPSRTVFAIAWGRSLRTRTPDVGAMDVGDLAVWRPPGALRRTPT
jgi:hypothetical protein